MEELGLSYTAVYPLSHYLYIPEKRKGGNLTSVPWNVLPSGIRIRASTVWVLKNKVKSVSYKKRFLILSCLHIYCTSTIYVVYTPILYWKIAIAWQGGYKQTGYTILASRKYTVCPASQWDILLRGNCFRVGHVITLSTARLENREHFPYRTIFMFYA